MAELVEDILAPIQRYLTDTPSLQELCTVVPTGGINPVLGPPNIDPSTGLAYLGDPQPWIFYSYKDRPAPYAHIEGTGSCAVTLANQGDWSRANLGSYHEFPEITVYYHCDVTRGLDGAPMVYDARAKCRMLHARVRRAMHVINTDSADGFIHFDSLRVASSKAGMSLQIMEDPAGDGLLIGRATFELTM